MEILGDFQPKLKIRNILIAANSHKVTKFKGKDNAAVNVVILSHIVLILAKCFSCLGQLS